MMMRTSYIQHYCPECSALVDHVKLSYVRQTILVCVHCQNESIEEPVEKTYTLVAIYDEDFNTERRRKMIAELECTTASDKFNEVGTKVEQIMVTYPAYKSKHYIASVSAHPGCGFINYKDAEIIAKEIRKFTMEE